MFAMCNPSRGCGVRWNVIVGYRYGSPNGLRGTHENAIAATEMEALTGFGGRTGTPLSATDMEALAGFGVRLVGTHTYWNPYTHPFPLGDAYL